MNDAAQDNEPGMVARAIFLSRLSDELADLGQTATILQEAIHQLPLAHSDSATRRVLQSTDRLTQSLACLSAALKGLSDLPLSTEDYDLSTVLRGVFLESVRNRLALGRGAAEPLGSMQSGEVELF